MSKVIIYHNPRCQKSRQTLKLLQEQGIEPEVVEYLKSPPTDKELNALLKKLDMKAENLVRKKEALYKEMGLRDRKLTEAEWVKTLVEHPQLLERPIVVNGSKAVLGRPPENVLEIL